MSPFPVMLQTFLLEEDSKVTQTLKLLKRGTQMAFGQLKDTWALQQSRLLGTQALGHSSTQAFGHSRHFIQQIRMKLVRQNQCLFSRCSWTENVCVAKKYLLERSSCSRQLGVRKKFCLPKSSCFSGYSHFDIIDLS